MDLPKKNWELLYFETETQVTDKGLNTLAGLKSLNRLILDSPLISAEGIRKLATLPQLNDLFLTIPRIDRECIDAFHSMSELTVLRLIDVSLTDAQLEQLAKTKTIKALGIFSTEHGMGKNSELQITEAGLNALSKNRSIERLHIEKCHLTLEDIQCLHDMPQLKYVHIGSDQLGENPWIAMPKIFPKMPHFRDNPDEW